MLIAGRAEVKELAGAWAAQQLADRATRQTAPFSHSIVLSMPAGTNEVALRDAARQFAADMFADRHDYTFTLHTDTPRPHIHLSVCSRGDMGERLNPKKADLGLWRQNFARALRDRGVDAEARLHGRTSVGLGGHVDLADVETSGEVIDLVGTLEKAAGRELLEELGDVECVSKEWVGLLIEHDSAMGRVHIGMIGLWRLLSLPAGIAEDAIGEVSLSSVSELKADVDRLETWSAMLLPWLSDVAIERQASTLAA
jgi:hypothetical protein